MRKKPSNRKAPTEFVKSFSSQRRKEGNPLSGLDPGYIKQLYQTTPKRKLATMLGCSYSQLDFFLSKHHITKARRSSEEKDGPADT